VTDATQDWRAGLRVTRSRSLSTAELGVIAQRRRRMRATAVAWLLSGPVIMVLCAVGILVAPEPREPMLSAARVIGFVVVFALPIPLCFATANDYFKRVGVLRRQSRDATVLVCEGPLADLVLRPGDRKKLSRHLKEESRVVLEVLSQSSLVWSINGRASETWIVAPRGHTVEPPDRARLAAQYVRPVETERGTFRLHQRRLSSDECAELRGYLPRLRSPRVIFALSLNVFAAAHVTEYVRNPTELPWSGIFVVTVVAWCDIQLVRLLRVWLRMSRDARDQSVVIYQSDPGADASMETVMEFLPHSRMAWTIAGRAAPWRRLYAPARSPQ
jgi:hypothetical protein